MQKIFLVAVVLFIGITSLGNDRRKLEKYKPKNLNEAVHQLDRLYPDTFRRKIMLMAEDEYVGLSDFGPMGTWIRNNWGLWKGWQLARHFDSMGVWQAEDMSHIIFTTYYRYLNKENWRLEEQIKDSKEGWRKIWTHQYRMKTDSAYRVEVKQRNDSLKLAWMENKKNSLKPGTKISFYLVPQCFLLYRANGIKVDGEVAA